MKQQVIILKGLPAAGKSFWAKEIMDANPNKYKRVNKDLLREMIDSNKYSKDNEKFILTIRDNLILQYIEAGYDVIVDDTNLAEKHIIRIKQLVGNKAEVVINDKFLNIPVDECVKRDMERPNPIGEDVIRHMYMNFIGELPKDVAGKIYSLKQQNKYPVIEYNPDLPDCIIVDIDGTVALHNGRSPYELEKCYTDLPNYPIIQIVNQYVEKAEIIFMSGREDSVKEMTGDWLLENGLPRTHLHMRKTGDFRKDVIVKKEMYKEHIEGKYNVRFVLDDRNQTVKGWRELGLTCLQVAEGNF